MKAMNPHDLDGPPIDVTFADGVLWTRKCEACGFENGGFIEHGKNTRGSAEKDPYEPVNQPCAMCKEGPVKWSLIG